MRESRTPGSERGVFAMGIPTATIGQLRPFVVAAEIAVTAERSPETGRRGDANDLGQGGAER